MHGLYCIKFVLHQGSWREKKKKTIQVHELHCIILFCINMSCIVSLLFWINIMNCIVSFCFAPTWICFAPTWTALYHFVLHQHKLHCIVLLCIKILQRKIKGTCSISFCIIGTWDAEPGPVDFNQIFKTHGLLTTFHTTVWHTRILSPEFCSLESNYFFRKPRFQPTIVYCIHFI